ncbi:MAG: hypothetical protein QM724_11020 [Flavobacteriales bacterium]
MPLFRTLRSSENFHIVLWLFKDLCWVMDLHLLGVVMIVPTVAMAVWIAWRCRGEAGELLHSLAVVCWICANSVWMVGEFFYQDRTRHFASGFFIAGLLCVAWYYLVLLPRGKGGDNEDLTHA